MESIHSHKNKLKVKQNFIYALLQCVIYFTALGWCSFQPF
ncbi:hypothetical protein PUND_b0641 [Pseudoalteromonas undina]|nr:hypothetical protein PUND_b0641 [Pseudoalteromonas undina]